MSLEGSGSTIEPHPHIALSAAPIVPASFSDARKIIPGNPRIRSNPAIDAKTQSGNRAAFRPDACRPAQWETGNFDRNRCFLPHAERFAAASRFIAQEPSSRNACSKAHRDSVELRSGRGARGPATSARGEGAAPKPQRKDVPGAFDAKRLEGMLGGCKIVCNRAKRLTCPGTPWRPSLPGRPEFTAQAACEPGANLTS